MRRRLAKMTARKIPNNVILRKPFILDITEKDIDATSKAISKRLASRIYFQKDPALYIIKAMMP